MRRFLVLVLLLVSAAPAARADNPFTPPRDRWYAANDAGYWSDGVRVRLDASCLELPAAEQATCSLEAFRARPFVVVALVDTGINPYHHDFRAPDFVHHPSQYIEGFPATAQALRPSFAVADAQGYDAARDADLGLWLGARTNRLYWIPGTRIVGAYSTSSSPGEAGYPARPIIDDQGHGTGVASVSSGQFFGSNPNALIVAVEGLGESSLRWATSQPWIDVVSNSWGPVANLPGGDPTITRAATDRGQTVVFSAGNGATNTNSSDVLPPAADPCRCKTPDSNPSITDGYGGPSWIVSVGAISPVNGQAHWWHSVPADVSSFGSKWRSAAPFGVRREHSRDFGGTSCAAPVTAGVVSAVIERARAELGDTRQGPRSGQVVATGPSAPAAGPLADGSLTRTEAEETVLKTAFPVPADPERIAWDYAIRPTTDAYYAYQGYGVVDRGSKARALAVLMGEQALPARPEADSFIAWADAVRDTLHDR